MHENFVFGSIVVPNTYKDSRLLLGKRITRIIIINGHREIGLVLAGRYVLRKSLVVAIKSKLPYKLSLHKSKTVVDFHFEWPFDCSKKSTLAIKMIQKV